MTTPQLRPSVPLTFHHEPQVWIGCLQCYNEGRLVGSWYPASEAGDITTSKLHGRPIPRETHEELWVFDLEGFPEANEMDPATAQKWGDLYDEVGDERWPALCAWVRSGSHVEDGDGMPSVSTFDERYVGEWEDFATYAQQYAESIDLFDGLPAGHDAVRYFNWRSWIQDLEQGFTVEPSGNGGVWIFRDA